MAPISLAGSALADRYTASRAGLGAAPATDAPATGRPPVLDAGTRLSLGGRGAPASVYSPSGTALGKPRLWASSPAQDDPVSALMARNHGTGSPRLADQWRGLGGALLSQFARTGQGYRQALADDPAAQLAEQAAEAAEVDVPALQAATLAELGRGGPAVGLKIVTRSGQTIELRIELGTGEDASAGLRLEIKTSGETSAEERTAIERLAAGLDHALEGLGRMDSVALDLAGLLSYDRSQIVSLDLSASTPRKGQALEKFALHLDETQQAISLKGKDGELDLSVKPGATEVGGTAAQRRAALESALDRLAGAGERGRASAALVKQMKTAFTQLQTAALGPASPEPTDQATSGLADFEARLGGETRRSNRYGATKEAGELDYRLSQATASQGIGQGVQSITQTLTEQLSADYKRAPGDRMLDPEIGTFSAIRIRDKRTQTTLIEADAKGLTRALRKTDLEQLQTISDFENHRELRRQSLPWQESRVERLR